MKNSKLSDRARPCNAEQLKIKNLFKYFIIWCLGFSAFLGQLEIRLIKLIPSSFAAIHQNGGYDDNSTSLGTLEGLPGGFDPGTTEKMAANTLTKMLSNTIGVLTLVGGLMFIIYFVLGGISWITSSGEREKVEKAKKQMTNAAIGLIIVVASYGIAFIIGKVLGIEILNPAYYIIDELSPGGIKE